jgi:hypothetical protein
VTDHGRVAKDEGKQTHEKQTVPSCYLERSKKRSHVACPLTYGKAQAILKWKKRREVPQNLIKPVLILYYQISSYTSAPLNTTVTRITTNAIYERNAYFNTDMYDMLCGVDITLVTHPSPGWDSCVVLP